MKTITPDLLAAIAGKSASCAEGVATFTQTWPHGAPVKVSVDEFIAGGKLLGTDPLHLYRLLPTEGANSQHAFGLWAAAEVAHLCAAPALIEALDLSRQHRDTPGTVTPAQARAAREALAPLIRAEAGSPSTAAAQAAAAVSASLASLDTGPFAKQTRQAAPYRAAEAARRALVLSGDCATEEDAQKRLLQQLVAMLTQV